MILFNDVVLLVGLAFILAAPVSYWLNNIWIANFAYKAELNPLLFIYGGLGAVTVAFITISFHTIKAAMANPVEALKYE